MTLLEKKGFRLAQFTWQALIVQVLSPMKVILAGGTSKASTTLFVNLAKTTNPLSSDLGVVHPAWGVTLVLAVTNVVCQEPSSIIHLVYTQPAKATSDPSQKQHNSGRPTTPGFINDLGNSRGFDVKLMMTNCLQTS